MLDIIKKSIYLGLGAASVTKEKVESLIDELIEKGQLAKEEKPKIVQEILDRIEKEEKEVLEKIKIYVREAVESIGISTQEDIKKLREQIQKLEKKLSEK